MSLIHSLWGNVVAGIELLFVMLKAIALSWSEAESVMSLSNHDDKPWSVYLIRCGDQSLYTGISNDVAARFAVHQSGKIPGAKYLRGRHPLTLVYTIVIGSRSEASRVEYRIKKLPKQKKEQLIAGQLHLNDLGIFSVCKPG